MTTKISVNNILNNSIDIDKLSDVDTTSTTLTGGQVLSWSTSQLKWVPVTIAGKVAALSLIFGA